MDFLRKYWYSIDKKFRDEPADLFIDGVVVVVVVDCDGGATGVGTVFSLSEIQP